MKHTQSPRCYPFPHIAIPTPSFLLAEYELESTANWGKTLVTAITPVWGICTTAIMKLSILSRWSMPLQSGHAAQSTWKSMPGSVPTLFEFYLAPVMASLMNDAHARADEDGFLCILQLDRKLSKYLSGCGRLHYDPDRSNGLLHVTVPSLRIAIEQMRVSPLRSILHALRSASWLVTSSSYLLFPAHVAVHSSTVG